MESRLNPLSETTRQLLQSAAIIGRGFDFDTSREGSGRSEDETVTGLEELTAAAIVTEFDQTSSELRYDFSHEKLCNLVYEKISPARWRLLHRRIAETLANHKIFPNREQPYAQIGPRLQ